jgi:alpha-mannosidase
MLESMTPRFGWMLALCLAGWSALPGKTQAEANKPVLYYVPHTHWEGAVFKTREEYLEMGLSHILQALQLLREYPEYRFTLDQVAYFKPFLERYPEATEAFRRYVREGRLDIVGGMDVMPDVVKPGGEMFVRQMLYGKRYCREALGVEVKAAWLLDTFGHHPQLPQLLRQAGFETFWFCRGVPRRNGPSEFIWQGIDGTTIPAIWLPGFYGLFYGPPREFPKFAEFFENRYESLTPYTHGLERVGLAGVDVCPPEAYVPPLIQQFNRDAQRPFTIRTATPADFAKVVAKRSDLTTVTNELSPIFQGTYSSRIELKQLARELEQLLLRAENLAAVAQWLGKPIPEQILDRGWEPVLFNQAHDLCSGVMTDHVYDDTLRSSGLSRQVALETIEAGWAVLASALDTRVEGIPVAVFNPLSWVRSDVAQVEIGFGARGAREVALTDASGDSVPVQLEGAERSADGSLTRARLVFVARDVPAFGCALYQVRAGATAGEAARNTAVDPGPDAIENESYRIIFNRANGAITSLWDKSQAWEALVGPANVIAREVDKGDLWELYRGLDGASCVAMTNYQAVPNPTGAQLSSAVSAKPGAIQRGPVYSEFTTQYPFAGGDLATRVRLYRGVRRVEVRTDLVNREKYVRYQALFPSAVTGGKTVEEIPFGAVERPDGIEFAAQTWVDHSDGARGLALLNLGLPGQTVTEGTLMLSLMRSHNLGAYGFGGGYEPGMSSESGFQIGRPLSFQYALVPHRGNWRSAQVYRAGLEFNHPLLVRKLDRHAGRLPARWSLLEVSEPNIVVSAVKPGPGGAVIVRSYEAAGVATRGVKLALNGPVVEAREANLLEDSGRVLPLTDGKVALDFRPFEIKTLKLQLPVR